MTDASVTPLPLTWRSYARAGFFIAIMVVFGIGAISSGGLWLGLIGVALTAIGLLVGVDFLWSSRRWRFFDEQLWVPRAWSPHRSIGVSRQWQPHLDSIGRRDSVFQVQTPAGVQSVAPNLLVARSDVRQWLHLIGETRSSR